MLHHFDHRWATYEGANTRDVSLAEKADASFTVMPRYWVRALEVNARVGAWRKGWLAAYRWISRAEDERCFILGILPLNALGNSCPAILLAKDAELSAACLVANLSSYALDYVARQKLGGSNMTFGTIYQFAVLPPITYLQPCPWSGSPPSANSDPRNVKDWMLPRVLELTYTAWDLGAFAQDCGWHGPPFRWEEDRRFLLRCELDAAFFHFYLGSEDEWRRQPEALARAFPTPRDAVSYIMDTFPILKRKDETKYGNYRTKLQILVIYDRMQEAIITGRPYETILSPPPADPSCCHPPREGGR
jgi:hypothetical protein